MMCTIPALLAAVVYLIAPQPSFPVPEPNPCHDNTAKRSECYQHLKQHAKTVERAERIHERNINKINRLINKCIDGGTQADPNFIENDT